MILSRRTMILGVSSAPIVLLGTSGTATGISPIYSENSVAIDGTDPVAYFTEGTAIAGVDTFTHGWNGAIWKFSTRENRIAFAADPTSYAPQYGGYCAYAVSEGYTAPTVPEAWTIVEGKLYLNFSLRIQRRWEQDIPGRIAAADKNWPKILA